MTKRKAPKSRTAKRVATHCRKRRVKTQTPVKALTQSVPAATGPTGERIRPSHWRYNHAKLALVERGISPTTVNLAKELGVSRVALWKLRQKYQWLDEWVDGLVTAANVHEWGSVERRHAMLAIQGSTASAEVFAKMRGGHFTRQLAPGDGVPLGGTAFTLNLLVPRPDLPGLPAQTAAVVPVVAAPAPAGGLIPRPSALPRDIPTVHVR